MAGFIRGASDPRVMAIIAAHYNELTERCRRLYRGGDIELCDVMHDAIMYVSTIPESKEKQTPSELLDFFVYKFRMIAFGAMKRKSRTVVYLDSIKAKGITDMPDE